MTDKTPKQPKAPAPIMPGQVPPLSKEAKEKLDKIKKELDQFKKEVLAKFDKYIMGISFLVVFDFWSRGQDVDEFLSQQRPVVRWGIYIFMLLAILTIGVLSHSSQFIYFQF